MLWCSLTVYIFCRTLERICLQKKKKSKDAKKKDGGIYGYDHILGAEYRQVWTREGEGGPHPMG